jgi:hypothetical protein
VPWWIVGCSVPEALSKKGAYGTRLAGLLGDGGSFSRGAGCTGERCEPPAVASGKRTQPFEGEVGGPCARCNVAIDSDTSPRNPQPRSQRPKSEWPEVAQRYCANSGLIRASGFGLRLSGPGSPSADTDEDAEHSLRSPAACFVLRGGPEWPKSSLASRPAHRISPAQVREAQYLTPLPQHNHLCS